MKQMSVKLIDTTTPLVDRMVLSDIHHGLANPPEVGRSFVLVEENGDGLRTSTVQEVENIGLAWIIKTRNSRYMIVMTGEPDSES